MSPFYGAGRGDEHDWQGIEGTDLEYCPGCGAVRAFQ